SPPGHAGYRMGTGCPPWADTTTLKRRTTMSARWLLRAVITLALVGASCLAVAHPAAASPGDEGYFVDHINAIRAGRGLGTLVVDAQLTNVARSWSQHMAADGTL